MKRLLVLLMALLLMVSALPASTFAMEENDPEFEAFLAEIGWNKQEYINYLLSKEWYMEDVMDIAELGTPLTEEGVQAVLIDFELTREELNALLVEYGDIEEGQDVLDGTYLIFIEELYYYVEFYLDGGYPVIDENGPEFAKFLDGIGWEKEAYLAYLESKGWPLELFTDVSELGTPLSEEGVQAVLADYELTREELNVLLVEYGDIEQGQDVLDGDYIIFNEELHSYVGSYLNDEYQVGIDFGDMDIFTEIGLTDEELIRLYDHLATLNVEDEAFITQLDAILARMEAIPYFESADDLDAAQIAEILDIFTDLTDLFQIETSYFLTNGEEKQPLSLTSLLTMETTNGYDLLIEVYDTQGEFLADVVFTAEMFGSEIIKETGKDIEVIEEVIAAPKTDTKNDAKPVKKDVKKETQTVQTAKGAKLPKTASDYATNALFGLAFMLIGLLLFRRLKTAGN